MPGRRTPGPSKGGRGGAGSGSGRSGGSSRPASGRRSAPSRSGSAGRAGGGRGGSGRAGAQPRSRGGGRTGAIRRDGGEPVGRSSSGSLNTGARASKEHGLGGRQVEGRQAVREMLIAGSRRTSEIWIATELEGDDGVADIVALARSNRVPVQYVNGKRLDAQARTDAPQGVLAQAAEVPEIEFEALLRRRSGTPFYVAIDGVTDPGNLGAILRSCDGAGVDAVVLPRHRAVHVTPTVAKSAAGAIEHVPMSLVGGLPTALARLKEVGVWIVGLDDAADRDLFDLGDLADQGVCLVLGAEGEGLSRLVRERCDMVVAIPMLGRLSSLNVSAAAALATYEVARARRAEPAAPD